MNISNCTSRKTLAIFACAFLTQSLIWSDPGSQQKRKPTIAVSVLQNKSGNSSISEQGLTDRLITALAETKQFRVLERAEIEKLFQEHHFNQSGAVDPKEATELGKMFGADLLIFGFITRADQEKTNKFAYDQIKTTVELDIRGVDTNTSEIAFSQKVAGEDAQKIVTTASGEIISGIQNPDTSYGVCARNAIETISKKLVEFYQPIGFVVSVDKGQITTNIGIRKGVQKGDHLIVYRTGKEMFDPETKESLGFSKAEIGSAQVSDVDYKTSIALLDDPSTKVHEKDQVKIKE